MKGVSNFNKAKNDNQREQPLCENLQPLKLNLTPSILKKQPSTKYISLDSLYYNVSYLVINLFFYGGSISFVFTMEEPVPLTIDPPQ